MIKGQGIWERCATLASAANEARYLWRKGAPRVLHFLNVIKGDTPRPPPSRSSLQAELTRRTDQPGVRKVRNPHEEIDAELQMLLTAIAASDFDSACECPIGQ